MLPAPRRTLMPSTPLSLAAAFPFPLLEALEPRLAPAGTVILTTAGGVLTITGDAEPNYISIVASHGERLPFWQVTGDAGFPGTRFILNGQDMGNTGFQIPAQQGIKAAMGDGDDDLILRPAGSSVTILPLGLNLNMGRGPDEVYIGSGDSSLQVQGATVIDLGEGDDAFISFGSTLFAGAVDVRAGAGGDSVSFQHVNGEGGGSTQTFLKGIKVDLGTGANVFRVAEIQFDVVGGPFSVVNAGGVGLEQRITLAPVSGIIQGPASLAVSAGDTSLTIGVAGGSLRFGSTLAVTGSTGFDAVFLNGKTQVAGAVTVNLRDGINGTYFENNSETTLGALTVMGGSSEDTVQMPSLSQLKVAGALNFSLGAGENKLTLAATSSLSAQTLSYTGTQGDDTLNLQSFDIGGSMPLNLGDGINYVSLNAPVATHIGGALTVRGGAGISGQDDIWFGQRPLQVGGGIMLDLKDGANFVRIPGKLTAAALTLKGGAGADQIIIDAAEGVVLGGALTLALGGGLENSVLTSEDNHLKVGSLIYTSAGLQGRDVSEFYGTLEVLGNMAVSLGGGGSEFTFKDDTVIDGSLTYTALGGKDALLFDAALLCVRGAVKINLGSGVNLCTLAVTQAAFNGAFSYTGGTGSDSLYVHADEVRISGPTTFRGGDGDAVFDLFAAQATLGGLVYTGGRHADGLRIGAPSGTAPAQIQILGGLTATLGEGRNVLDLRDTAVVGAVKISSTTKAGANPFAHQDFATFHTCTIHGPVLLSMGAGLSILRMDDCAVQGDFTANLGAGADVLLLDNLTGTPALNRWSSQVMINTGAGADTLQLGHISGDAFAANLFHGPVVIDGGNETDTLRDIGSTYHSSHTTKNI